MFRYAVHDDSFNGKTNDMLISINSFMVPKDEDTYVSVKAQLRSGVTSEAAKAAIQYLE